MNISKIHILHLYFLLFAFYSAAIPLGSFYLKFDWIAAIILSLYGSILFLRHKIRRLPVSYFLIFFIYLLLNGLIAQMSTGEHFKFSTYISYLFQYVLALLVFVTIVSMRISTQQATKLLTIWVWVASCAGLLALVQKMSGVLLVDKFLFIPYYADGTMSTKIVSGVLAPTAWFSEASWLGAFLVVPTSYMIFNLIIGNYFKRSLKIHCLILTLLIVGLALGYSLTAILAVGVSMATMMYLSGKYNVHIIVVILIASAVLYYYSDSEVISLQIARFTELWYNITDFKAGNMDHGTNTSFYARSVGFAAGIKAFINNPIFGHGIGQSPIPYESGVLSLLAETGLIGALLFYGLPFLIIKKLLKISRYRQGRDRLFALSLIICLTGDYANSLITHNSFHLQRWLLVSIAFSWILSLAQDKKN